MRIGLFGGTFDPIHFGHLHQAHQMLKIHHLDEIWFIPAYISPHKLDRPPVAAEHRLEMVKLATADEPKFRVLDLEIKRGRPSYTIDTVRELQKEGEFFLLISDDMVASLPKWQEIDALVETIPLLVGRRKGEEPPETGNPAIDAAVKKGWTRMPVMRISATALRKQLGEGKSCEDAIPAAVLAYIKTHKLYEARH